MQFSIKKFLLTIGAPSKGDEFPHYKECFRVLMGGIPHPASVGLPDLYRSSEVRESLFSHCVVAYGTSEAFPAMGLCVQVLNKGSFMELVLLSHTS